MSIYQNVDKSAVDIGGLYCTWDVVLLYSITTWDVV